MKILAKAIRNAARGEDCTLQIMGICNHDPETTVFAHYPDEHNGMGMKPDDISGGFACHACHDAIDRRSGKLASEEREFHMRRSQTRTLRRLLMLGVISIKGVKL